MYQYRPSRALVREGIMLSRTARGEQEIPSGDEGISVDTVVILVATINKLRDRCKARNHTYDFESLVRRVCKRTPFDEKREHAYEIVVLRYYAIISALRAGQKKIKRGRE